MVFGKGVNDMNSKVSSYSTWHSMIRRCYSSVYQKSKPSYVGTKVNEEWLLLSNFHSWYISNYIENWQLDKDLLSDFGKIYSQDNCCFLPNEINCALKFDLKISDLPPGVSFKSENKKYVAQYSIVGKDGKRKSVHLCYSKDPQECFNAYKNAKETYLKELAVKYKDILKEHVFNKLNTLEVK